MEMKTLPFPEPFFLNNQFGGVNLLALDGR